MKWKTKITPLLIFSLVLLYLSVIEFDLFDNKIEENLFAYTINKLLAFEFIGAAIIIFIIDRLLLRKIDIKKIWIIELLALIVITPIWTYSSKYIKCNLSNEVNYFAIIYGVENEKELEYSFPFNAVLEIPENGIYLTKTLNNYNTKVIGVDYYVITITSYTNKTSNKKYHYKIIEIENQSTQTIDSLRRQIHLEMKRRE